MTQTPVQDLTAPTPGQDSLLDRAFGSPRAARTALLTAAGKAISYGELRAAVDRLVLHLPDAATGKRLVHLPLRAEVHSVAAYLATLEAGHVALVTSDEPRTAAMLERYRPDVTATGDPEHPFEFASGAPLHVLHPDLALLLSTSGSTGSPKLVRLSHRNLAANASAIAKALRLTETDRTITSLPLHYCFGLSVLHSHLVAGASVVLHEGSVLDSSLWDAIDGLGVTNLAAVPHMVELMESTGVLEASHPSLRLMAQAGGRMHPDRVRRTADLGRAQGWGLSVMYGQTEATARICILDPALAAENPDAVGRPVSGTSLHLDTTVPEAVDGAGEVVVRGPGVMMGYAEHPDDLALGPMLTELRTGDLGRIGPDGLLRIVGRRSGFVKVMGVRIDVAAVEHALDAAGHTACVGGDGTRLLVAVEPRPSGAPDATAAEARRIAGQASGLGAAAVAVAVTELPRLANGKLDRPGCTALVLAGAAGHAAEATAPAGAKSAAAEVAKVVSEVLGTDSVDLGRSFVQHGGDSLSHVQASLRLEGIAGPLPRGWHHRTLSELADLAAHRRNAPADPGAAGLARTRARPPRIWRTVETSVVMRALAVVAICGSHADLFDVMGGAHLLLAIAGYNTVRFGLSAPGVADRWRATARILIGVAVPTMLIALFAMLTTGRYGWSNILLSHWLIGDTTEGSTRNEYWFIDALVAGLLVLTAVISVPALARAWKADPWRVAAWFTAAALVPRFAVLALTEDSMAQSIMPTTLWLVGVGAAAAHADTRRRRWLTLALGVVGGATFFADQPLRNAVVVAGLAALILVPRMRVPAFLLPLLGLLAAASLYIYLVQFLVLSAFENDVVETVAALGVGCLLWRLADRPMRRLQDLVPAPNRWNERTP
ncbi:AMP-binding protein [Paeniglutamicibacter sp. ZC-3]|uniref:non-ribosomal peptide synthetase n=1 Tax=Paeniglutamicibacter sp. ZC-3 TaxID=2986919 RepID=UPI0021F7B29B|nr:AMP-binding protein [Paeniglutamicibacter sp. ZC-3]MCV9996406.1 AMP-binding protein [Paeniglutamicibacter sp. ZC-3]